MSTRSSVAGADAVEFEEYPPDPRDIRAGELGEASREYERRADMLTSEHSANRRRNDLEQRVKEYERIVEAATPESDLLEVAAAEVGIRVLTRALDNGIRYQSNQDRQRFEDVTRRYEGLQYRYRL